MSAGTFECGMIEGWYDQARKVSGTPEQVTQRTRKSHPKCKEYAAGYKLGRQWAKNGEVLPESGGIVKLWLRYRLENA